ncbi:flavin-binding monooxygenase-like protein [Stemphylium lycopersici]|nr:flavin-binding monooxygenase-like protein [Stemphylium lycopersici]
MGGSEPWPQVPVGNKDHTDAAVVIIGAGISGMCMAIDLIKRNQCHNFIIVEKSSSFGGTWHDNKYPGCCCDVWSMLYSYSFEQNPDWTRKYPGQEEILDYLRNVARKYNLYKYIRFNTSVEAATWDDTKNRWKVNVNVTGGKDAEFHPAYSIECDFLVSAVGQLNLPQYPNIEGLHEFKGATAAQIIPEILPQTSSLTVYQRSPNWVTPRLDGPVSALKRTLLRYIPPLRWRIRSTMMDFRESFYAVVSDSESDFATLVRTSCTDLMSSQIPNRPDLWEKLTPDYSPGCKRIIVSDDYYPALASPKTHLETQAIKRITESGIELADGTHNTHDTIVLATGFRTVEFLHPIRITGTHGRSLSSIWQASGGATALYGTVVPCLPNFGMLYGPNTNLGHNSIILMIEAQSRYLNTLVSAVLDACARNARIGLVPRLDKTEEWNKEIQEVLAKSSFADPKCSSWYKNEAGRITNNWSGNVVQYQQMLSRVDWGDYEITGGVEGDMDGSVVVCNGDGGEGTLMERKTDGSSSSSGGGSVSASKVVFGSGKLETRIGRVREESLVSNTTLVLGTLSAVAAGAAWVYRGKLPRRLGVKP